VLLLLLPSLMLLLLLLSLLLLFWFFLKRRRGSSIDAAFLKRLGGEIERTFGVVLRERSETSTDVRITEMPLASKFSTLRRLDEQEHAYVRNGGHLERSFEEDRSEIGLHSTQMVHEIDDALSRHIIGNSIVCLRDNNVSRSSLVFHS